MKLFNLLKLIFVFAMLLVTCGCQREASKDIKAEQSQMSDVAYEDYAPAKIEVMSLTEILKAGKGDAGTKVRVYISLLDKFDSQIKYPSVFRFELYEKVQYSGQSSGKRLAIWPDINLTDAAKNKDYWQDTFRAYKFELDFDFQSNQSYILQITCVLPDGRRLAGEFQL